MSMRMTLHVLNNVHTCVMQQQRCGGKQTGTSALGVIDKGQ